MSNLLQNIELLIWSPATKAEPPSVDLMSGALAIEGFRAELAETVPVSTAFRRAVTALQGKDAVGADVKATIVANGKLRGQLDRVVMDPVAVRHPRQPGAARRDRGSHRRFAIGRLRRA